MELTTKNLSALQAGLKLVFQQAFDSAVSTWQDTAMVVPSDAALEHYGWMKDLPGMREWVGSRVIHGLETAEYSIHNKHWEETVSVNKDNIEDDRLGIYKPRFAMLGESAKTHPNKLVRALYKLGFTTLCYDGQYYFDTDHIGYDEAGEEVSVSNLQPGAGEPWYLADLRKAHLKPMVFQDRTKIKFSALDKSTDEKVFMENEIVYGIDGRYNAAHGFWELAAASKAELNAENYAALRAQMVALRKSNGEPKGVVPNVLIHGPALEGRARKLLINERNDAGASNEWAGTAKPKMAEWLG